MPTSINDWNDMDAVRNNTSGDYVLENDLTDSTAGFSGIGDSWDSVNIDGTFDGNGYTIRDWTTDPSSSGGFFQSISGTVKFLRLAQATMEGEDPVLFDDIGGFAAEVASGGVVKNCAAETFLEVQNDAGRTDIAGFVGINNGTIQDCHAESRLTKSGDGGDLTGFVTQNGGTIERCFAAPGNYTQNTSGGKYGFVRDAGTETDCYWCTNCTGAPSSTGGSATGLTASEMQGDAAKTNMGGFDFQDTWQAEFGDYPSLRDPAPTIITVNLAATGSGTGVSATASVDSLVSLTGTGAGTGTAQTVVLGRTRGLPTTGDGTGVGASATLSRRRGLPATATASGVGTAVLDVTTPFTDLTATGSATGTGTTTVARRRGLDADATATADATTTVGRRRALDGDAAATGDGTGELRRVAVLSASGSADGDGTGLFVLVREGQGIVSTHTNRVIRVTPKQYVRLVGRRANTVLDDDTIE